MPSGNYNFRGLNISFHECGDPDTGGFFIINRSLGGPILGPIGFDIAYMFDPIVHPIPDIGWTEYRCLYIKNKEETRVVPRIEMFGECRNDPCRFYTELAIGLGVAAVNGVEPAIPNAYIAPSGVNFVVATESNPLVFGPLNPQEHKAIWFRRTVFSSCPFISFDFNFSFRFAYAL